MGEKGKGWSKNSGYTEFCYVHGKKSLQSRCVFLEKGDRQFCFVVSGWLTLSIVVQKLNKKLFDKMRKKHKPEAPNLLSPSSNQIHLKSILTKVCFVNVLLIKFS